ncbi:MAG: peptidylprolyl isomerase [Nanoarchaeota archaeon]|nr:peptidylprolyl isomerase [Nanoarchaeota archaeon]MBU0977644.1 peptidylprolyl isomerase [Nanoarchaeota archaeon]
MPTVKKGDTVTVEYEGRFESGEIFDSTSHGDHSHPLTFTAGNSEVVRGFDQAVLGMKVGEEKEIKIKPEDAYGSHNPKLIQKLPKTKLPAGQEPKPGLILMLRSQQGHQIPAKITGVDDKDITIDLNHPLAGKTLVFKIKVTEVKSSK